MIKVTTLVDNHAFAGFKAEHGYSLYIEAGQCRILFDTGQGEAFNYNLQKLGIEAGKIDFLVLSHGHYDHTGGLKFFLDNNHHARVYSLPGVSANRYRRREDGAAKYIGMPPACQQAFANLPAWRRCHPESDDSGIGYLIPGIGLTGRIPRICEFEPPEDYFFLDEATEKPDEILDDNSLWLETPTGIILFCGCCHAGLVNTVNAIKEFVEEKFKLRGIIGGMHLANATLRKLTNTVAFINQLKPEFLIPAHCTGAVLVQSQFDPATRVVSSAAGEIYNFTDQ